MVLPCRSLVVSSSSSLPSCWTFSGSVSPLAEGSRAYPNLQTRSARVSEGEGSFAHFFRVRAVRRRWVIDGARSQHHPVPISMAALNINSGTEALTEEREEVEGAQVGGNGSVVDSSSFIRPHLQQLKAYTPIEPFEILSARLGRDAKDIVKLDANENPYGPPPEVLEALGGMRFPNIYPDPESRVLRAALALDTGVDADSILVGCGADELIDLIMRCVLDPGDAIVDCPPTFTMYAFDAAVNNARVIAVPRKDDFQVDVEGIKAAVKKHSPKILFLTSPNNPDGSLISDSDFHELIRLPVLVVLDEAYIEFAQVQSRMALVAHHENLIVLRTFSKRAGLAGLRVGYGAFPKGIISYIWRAKQPYNVSVAAEVAACAALGNQTYLQNVRDALVEERGRLMGLLQDVPFLHPFPSKANFILCSVIGGKNAKDVKEDLMKKGVMVRHYDKAELSNFIRISVGRPQDTDALMLALQSV